MVKASNANSSQRLSAIGRMQPGVPLSAATSALGTGYPLIVESLDAFI